MIVDFSLNGAWKRCDVDPMRRLLDVIRVDFGLTGTKEGCGEGECGACGVLIDGILHNACIVPVGSISGRCVETIEAVAETELGRRIVTALQESGAVQCGYCTPGVVVTAAATVAAAPPGQPLSRDEVAGALSGNLCRCTGYQTIVDAVTRVAAERSAAAPPGTTERPTSDAHRPPDLPLTEALRMLQTNRYTVIAGATDIAVRGRRGAEVPIAVAGTPLFLRRVAELHGVAAAGAGMLTIGAAVTLGELARLPNAPTGLEVILDSFASPATRNAATIGGNICNASPAGDLLPFLYAHDARIELVSAAASREVPIESFITGPGSTALQAGELVRAVHIAECDADYYFYRKAAGRAANALSKASVYITARILDGAIERIAIAIGAVAPTVVRLREVESSLVGMDADALLEVAMPVIEALNAYGDSIQAITDQRSTADYRKAVVLRLLHFALTGDLPRFLQERYP